MKRSLRHRVGPVLLLSSVLALVVMAGRAPADVVGVLTAGGFSSGAVQGAAGQSSIGRAPDGTQQRGLLVSQNRPPVANAVAVVTNEDQATPLILSATDPEGAAPTYTVTSNPPHGVLSGLAPNLTYTPNLNFNGTDTFTFKANDGQSDSNTAIVTILVNAVNDAPIAANDAYSVVSGTTLTIAKPGVLGNDSDVDGDALQAILVATALNGALALNADGSFTYTPRAGFSGADSFTYRAFDGALSSNLATVTITVSPAPALGLTIVPDTFNENAGATAATGTVSRANTDISAALTVALSSNDTTEATVPATATIPAGSASVSFPVSAIDDGVADGDQTALISAAAPGFVSATATVRVLDIGAPPAPVATATPVPTIAPTATPVPTVAPVPTATSTPVPTATSTPVPTATSTPVPTATSTPTATQIPTIAPTAPPVPTAVPTVAPTPVPLSATLSGRVTLNRSFGLRSINVILSDKAGKELRRTQTDATGAYSFVDVAEGDYVVAPSFAGLFFNPASRSLNVRSNVRSIDFFAFGRPVLASDPAPAAPLADPVATPVPISTTGTTIDSGTIAIPLPIGTSPTPVPSSPPASAPTVAPSGSAKISGRVTASSSIGLRNINIILSDSAGRELRLATTDSVGAFLFADVPDGDYIITPQFPGLAFAPPSRARQVRGADVAGNNFIASVAR